MGQGRTSRQPETHPLTRTVLTCYSIFATPFPGFGNFTNTAGSWPGTIKSGREAISFIRSCALRFEPASNVCAIGACFSRFSYKYMLSEAITTVPDAVGTLTYCDA